MQYETGPLTSFSEPGQATIVAEPVELFTLVMCSSPAGCSKSRKCGGTVGTGSSWFVTCAKSGICTRKVTGYIGAAARHRAPSTH